MLKELLDGGMIDGSCMTVTGKTLGENVAHAENRDPEVIRHWTVRIQRPEGWRCSLETWRPTEPL